MTDARTFAGRLADLLRREQGAMTDFLVALAEFDSRRGWLELGYSSLFYFLHRDLGLSKGAAHYRKTAAELIQRFPEIVEPLRDGRLCITGIVPLAKVLTPENRHEMLPKFFQRSKREARAVAAALQPATAAPHRDVITAVRPTPAPCLAVERDAVEPTVPGGLAAPLVQPVELPAPPPSLLPKPARRDAAEPLTADLSRLHVTVSRRFLEKLEAARAALSHTLPLATAEDILEAGLDLILAREARRKGIVKKPRKQRPAQKAQSPSHVPAAVRREVWVRDRGQCQWPLESGGICGSTLRVEFDHRVPLALGGASTTDNVRLLCRVHNDLAARHAFGDEWMDRYTRGTAPRGSARPGNEPASG